jgi:hypothetical protein
MLLDCHREHGNMTSKIRIRMGPVELEYEGSDEFLSDEVPKLLAGLSELCARIPTPTGDDEGGQKPSSVAGTTADFAARLGCKSGPDLAVAASARLTLGAAKTSFSRKELLDEMKSATGHYKATYSNNLSKIIKTLMGNSTLREVKPGTYALSADKAKELKKKLAP